MRYHHTRRCLPTPRNFPKQHACVGEKMPTRTAGASAALVVLLSLAGAASLPSGAPCENVNSDAECDHWARIGECASNPGFMKRNCARSCDSCGWQGDDYCTNPPSEAAKPNAGDIVKTFERAITFTQFGPKVHSSPNDESRPGPWVITFDNFITDEEADAFIATTDHHFKRSLAGDVVSPVRTSQQAWCQPGIADECSNSPLINRVHERVVNVTGVPKNNAEFFQVLKYQPGQFYRTHHDQNTDPDSLAGVRLFTFFIYLHTPDEGGETHFPKLGIKIRPKGVRADVAKRAGREPSRFGHAHRARGDAAHGRPKV